MTTRRCDEALRRGAVGDLADDHAFVAALRYARPDLHLAPAIVVGGDVGDSALGKVGLDLDALAAQEVDLGAPQLHQVVGEDLRRHPDRDALDALHEDHGQLRGQAERLLVAPVVAGRELGERLVEEVLECQRREPALDVARRRRGVARQEVAEIALPVDEEALRGENDERVADRCVAVGMQLHRLADDVGHLVIAAVVHLEERVEDAALHGLESVAQVGDGAVEDRVARVVHEVATHQRLELRHRIRPPRWRGSRR
jgi:hypothetical protein